MPPEKTPYYVYIIECADKSYYTGITSDLKRRVKEHLSGRGCHYTAWKKAKKLRYSEKQPDRSSALKREAQIKNWSRKKKIELIKGRD